MNNLIDEKKLYELGDSLFESPNLGYKEFVNKEKLTAYFKENAIEVSDLGFETAFKVSIGSGKPHIGLLAELDGISTPGHKCANHNDSDAAHSCGHSTQCAIMASAFVALKKQGINKGKVTLFFCPAEEFVDIAYREKLIEEKRINYIGGKVNMLTAGQFNDVDLFIHLHTSSNPDLDFSINSSLGGFIYKKFIFKGKAAHAAVSPEMGINAMDMFCDFYEAVKKYKSSLNPILKPRVHGVILEGGSSINTIPDRIVYECYVRSIDFNLLLEMNKKIEKIAKEVSNKYHGDVEIINKPGYLPLEQSKDLNDIILRNMLKHSDKIEYDSKSIAAGDVGDISVFKPIVQFGYGGFVGVCHNKDLLVNDYKKAYLWPCEIVFDSVNDLLNDNKKLEAIINNFKPKMTLKQYLTYLNS